jgi:hypothetical protein
LDGPLPKLCPVIPTSNQDGRQAKNRKRGVEIKKKSSLKLLSQSQPSFAEMILGWPLPKLCPVIPTFNQDGRQAQNRKKGNEILIVHCCFSVNQNELKF